MDGMQNIGNAIDFFKLNYIYSDIYFKFWFIFTLTDARLQPIIYLRRFPPLFMPFFPFVPFSPHNSILHNIKPCIFMIWKTQIWFRSASAGSVLVQRYPGDHEDPLQAQEQRHLHLQKLIPPHRFVVLLFTM